MKEILINVESKEVRCAFLKEGLLYDLIVERKKTRQLPAISIEDESQISYTTSNRLSSISTNRKMDLSISPISWKTPRNSKRCLKWILKLERIVKENKVLKPISRKF